MIKMFKRFKLLLRKAYQKNLKSTLIIVSLIIIILMFFTFLCNYIIVIAYVHNEDLYYRRFLDSYIEIVKLSQQGVDVSNEVKMLKELHKNLVNGTTENINEMLDKIEADVAKLKQEAPRIILMNNLVKALTIIGMVFIPLFLYILIPRIYLYLWYRARKRWVIKSGHSK